MAGHLCVFACGRKRMAGGFGKLGHLDDVALECIEIDDECRSLNLGNNRADLGRGRVHRISLRWT
jgi:hypothetical protein